jgi:hypothetical protein
LLGQQFGQIRRRFGYAQAAWSHDPQDLLDTAVTRVKDNVHHHARDAKPCAQPVHVEHGLARAPKDRHTCDDLEDKRSE